MTAGWSPLPPPTDAGPAQADTPGEGPGGWVPMMEHPDLAHLHAQWAKTDNPALASGLRSALKSGRPTRLLGALVERVALAVLQPRLDEQRRLLAHLVRLNEALARRCDSLARGQQNSTEYLLAQMVDLSAHLESGAARREQDPG
ncbi:MAG: hypothetical protein ACYCS7_09420 [Acidimicrobiales bacterium]